MNAPFEFTSGAPLDLSLNGTAFPRNLEIRNFLYQQSMLGLSPRARQLDRLDAFAKALEYRHITQGWNGLNADAMETITPTEQVPYGFTKPGELPPPAFRRPTAPLRIIPTIIERFTGMLFGQGRTPKVRVEDDPDSEEFVRKVFERSRFWRTMYLARTYGGAMGSAMITATIRRGRFAYKAHSPKVIQDVVWEDEDLRIPAAVLIQYVFFKEHVLIDPKTGFPASTIRVPYLYRRIIDTMSDIVFVPERIGADGKMPEMQIDPYQSVNHQIGRFPGVLIQNLPTDDGIDGVPDCDGIYQMVETVDRLIAQQNFALLANMDPTLVLSRDPKMDQAQIPIKKGSENAILAGLGGSATYLEISGAGITAAGALIDLLRKAAFDRAECVAPDAEKLSGAAQSAKAIELLFTPMLVKSSRLRDQWGEGIETMAEVTLAFGREYSKPERYNGGKPQFNLPPKVIERDVDPNNPEVDVGSRYEKKPYHPGSGTVVSLEWGPYFAPTSADERDEINKIVTAWSGKLIDHETAVAQAAPLFNVKDVAAMLQKIREEMNAEREALMSGSFGAFGDDGDLPPLPEVPSADAPPADADEALKVAKAEAAEKMTGIQISSMLDILERVSLQSLTPEAGVMMLVRSLGFDEAEAQRLVDEALKIAASRPPVENPE